MKRFRVLIELEADDATVAEAVTELVRSTVKASKVEVVAESPDPGVQAAFIYDSSGFLPCHAVVKKKDGPWSLNRIGFCGVEPSVGPIGSVDKTDGGLCDVCRDYIQKGEDGNWYVKENAPLPKKSIPAQACGCDDDD
jgi:hypothetical protein